jgi:eukaryotic-like serine/threonine-protein kinase
MITPGPGVLIAQRYVLVRHLARGGMGAVWIAYHRDLEIDVAVKFMDPAIVADTTARTRFEREAKLGARLRSQHVVQILDYGVEQDTPYIVMELLEGESLSTRLARQRRLSLPIAARILNEVCKALQTAHEAGLVHRDLKPANIFLARKDEDEVVKILDFGIAKMAGPGATADTAPGTVLGSIHYMCLEQIRCSTIAEHRNDVWSAAVVLYRALTGRLPFPGDNFGAVIQSLCLGVGPQPSASTSGLPAGVDELFQRAFAFDPEQRFQSAQELAEALGALARSAPPQVFPGKPSWSTTVCLPAPLETWRELTREETTRLVVPSSSENTAGSISAVLTLQRPAEPAPENPPVRLGRRWPHAHRWWPAWMAGAIAAAFTGIVGVVTGSIPVHLQAAAATRIDDAPPPLVVAAAPSAAPAPALMTAAASTPEPAPLPSPSAAPSITAPTLPPKKAGLSPTLPRAGVGLPATKAAAATRKPHTIDDSE